MEGMGGKVKWEKENMKWSTMIQVPLVLVVGLAIGCV